nr:uncharacterized protein LOC119175712 isoform X2 [Rhipicephalus microplus]
MMGRKDAAVSYDNGKKHFSNVKYQRIQRTDDGFVDIQFQKTLSRVPKKAIALATCLFIGGSALIVLASFIFAGFFDPKCCMMTAAGQFLFWEPLCSSLVLIMYALHTMHIRSIQAIHLMTSQILIRSTVVVSTGPKILRSLS